MTYSSKVWLENCKNSVVIQKISTGLDYQITITEGDTSTNLVFNHGSIDIVFGKNPGIKSVELSATTADWNQLFSGGVFQPDWQSFGAIIRRNERFSIVADELVKAQCLAVLESMFEIIHQDLLQQGIGQVATAKPVQRNNSQVIGVYNELGEGESAYQAYYESTRLSVNHEKKSILFLHTAGADSRQYSDQLNDVDLAADWNLYAFDMPGHGRSSAPNSWENTSEYLLTKQAYLDSCVEFIEKVIAAPVVIVGCSMGAAIVLELANYRPDLVLGVVSLEAPWQSRGRRNIYLAHTKVNASLHNSAYIRSLMAPQSPKQYRDKACWIYSQGAYGMYSGDLHFYSEEFDGDIIGQQLSDSQIPIAFLTGSFDYSATPTDTKKVVRHIPHAYFEEMPNLGHFPMTENPDYFRPYFLQALSYILEEIKGSCITEKVV